MSIANVERQITDGWLLNVVRQLMQRQLKSTVPVKSIANKVGEYSGDRGTANVSAHLEGGSARESSTVTS